MSIPHHEDVVQVVHENRKPFVTTSDVDSRFPDVSRRTIQERLNDLAERGELEKRVIGANTAVWFPPC